MGGSDDRAVCRRHARRRGDDAPLPPGGPGDGAAVHRAPSGGGPQRRRAPRESAIAGAGAVPDDHALSARVAAGLRTHASCGSADGAAAPSEVRRGGAARIARLERDLALARELQFRLLPQSRPQLTNLDVAAKFVPARAIGGDLYDFVSYSLSRTAIVIGDVSGKGAPAAIYAALVSGILRSHAPMEPGPAEMQRAVNFSLGERRIEGQFVSMIYAVWDDENRSLQVANSGLPRPLYCHDDKIEVIEATGLPLGLFDDAEYDEFTFKANPGDVFVFFSDGILDARNKAGDMFGRSRVEEVVAGCPELSADCVVNSLFKAVAEHASGVETFDDQTVVAIKVKGEAASK